MNVYKYFFKTFHGHSYSKIEKDQDIIYIKILLYEWPWNVLVQDFFNFLNTFSKTEKARNRESEIAKASPSSR